MKFKHLITVFVLSCICSGCNLEVKIPELKGVVNDYANVIDDDDEKKIEALLKKQEAETSNQIVILTVDSMNGDSIEEYSIKVVEQWKLGNAAKDNGVLILHSTGDREMRIEVGHGLEGILTDVLCAHIIDDQMTPLFKNDKFGEGHLLAATSVIQIIGGEYNAEDAKAKVAAANAMTPAQKLMMWIIIVIVLIVIIFILFGVATGNIDVDDLGGGGSSGGGWSGGSSGGGYSGGGGSFGGGGSSGSY